MAKVKVAVYGTVGKTVFIDDALPARIAALETTVAALATPAKAMSHHVLTGLQEGNDHPQYPIKIGVESIAGAWTFTNNTAFTVENVNPFILFRESDAILDEKRWAIEIQGGLFIWKTQNDAVNIARNVLTWNRNGVGIDAMTYGNTTDLPTHQFFTNQAVFSPNSDWALTLAQENPNVFAERFSKVMIAGTTGAPTFKGVTYGSLGTRAAPAAAILNDGIVSLDGNGFDGTAFRTQAFIRAFATETWTNGAGHGSYWNISTTQPGQVNSRTVLAITQDGHLQLTNDNTELQLGAGTGSVPNKVGDLRLFHDGTNSVIRNDTGNLLTMLGASILTTLNTSGLSLVDASGAGGFYAVSAGNLTTADFRMQQGGVNRWIVRKSGGNETGSNVGSDFVIIRRDDAGAQIANSLTILRATGAWTIGQSADTGNHTIFGASLNVASAPSTDSVFTVQGSSGFNRDIRFRDATGTNRWLIRANATAESGANAGTDFEIHRRDDAGAQIARALQINRANGNWTFGDVVTNPSYTFLGTGAITAGPSAAVLTDRYAPSFLLMGA